MVMSLVHGEDLLVDRIAYKELKRETESTQ
jgi:hypothetical protein